MHRQLFFEQCEDRNMLATMADVVFLIDESNSSTVPGTDRSITQLWLQDTITRLQDTNLADSLTNKGITDIRYGLVGFGDLVGTFPNFTHLYAHSQFVDDTGLDPNDPGTFADAYFGDIEQLETAAQSLDSDGALEDGWDALEHAIAEYNFREGAVPVFILLQDEEGRVPLNDTLTRTGILAALQSKNIILNSLVVGQNQVTDPIGEAPDPLFDLSPYGLSSDIRILGVEADWADGLRDDHHGYHAFDTVNDEVPGNLTTTESEAIQISYNGSNTGATGMVGTGKSILIGQNITGGMGPTTEGYSAKSIPFGVVDMAGATEHTNLTNSISYSFPFYGTTETSLWVNEDGTISFDSAFTSGDNVDLSQTVAGQKRSTDPLIAVWNEKTAFALAA